MPALVETVGCHLYRPQLSANMQWVHPRQLWRKTTRMPHRLVAAASATSRHGNEQKKMMQQVATDEEALLWGSNAVALGLGKTVP
ncbi:Aa_trans domain-containing protein [Psidium guajava]|nr:Aa_trans domain-containing protein [Psidium guajava]